MVFDLDYKHEFKGMSAGAVFDGIMLWLNRENAKRIASEGKTSIEASHGSLRTLMSWESNGKKKLRFTIAPSNGGVLVTVTATPSMANSSDVARMAAEAKVNWGLLLEECWASVEGVAVTESGRRMEETKRELVASSRQTGRKMFVNGSIGFVAVMVLGIALITVTDGAVPSAVVVVPSVMFAMTAFWGAVKLRSR